MEPDVPTLDPETPTEAPAPDAMAEVHPAALLDEADALTQLAALDDAGLTEVTLAAARDARLAPDDHTLQRLVTLRRGLLLRNARPLLALCLDRLVDNALQQGDFGMAANAADTLWGVRELLGEVFKAHDAQLRLALAQEAGGTPAKAELTLHKALKFAQAHASGEHLAAASTAAARTLLALGQLLHRQGRQAEAMEWLVGAAELAPDEETATAARVALAPLLAD